MHLNLVISGEGIHEVKKLIFWQRKTILWAIFIEVGEIDTCPSLSPLLWGDDNVGEPIRVVGFSDNIGLDKFSHFFFYDFQLFRG